MGSRMFLTFSLRIAKRIAMRVRHAKKPVELYEGIFVAITLPWEIVIDQFAGSGNLG